jgi:hypothetical protein
MTKKKCALVLITGDRTHYLKQSIECCKSLIREYDHTLEVDVFLVSFDDIDINLPNIKRLTYERPDINSDMVLNFPRSQQQGSYDLETTKRISLGHLILFGLIPDTIHRNVEIFKDYDFILKSRSDLIFDFDKSAVKNLNIKEEILTFECFWGGCRYNKNYTNDHFVFGESEDVLKLISFSIESSMMNRFWNPEQYMTYLYSCINKRKVEMSTNKYYLLSHDRNSRKFIGYPMEKINSDDKAFLESMELNLESLNFTSEYDF